MRILAHYTIYDGNIYHLHVFDIDDNGVVTHFPVVEETANTCFVEGLAIVCRVLDNKLLGKLQQHLFANRVTDLSSQASVVRNFLVGDVLSERRGDMAVYSISVPLMAVSRIY